MHATRPLQPTSYAAIAQAPHPAHGHQHCEHHLCVFMSRWALIIQTFCVSGAIRLKIFERSDRYTKVQAEIFGIRFGLIMCGMGCW